MIVQTFVVILIVSVTIISDVNAASFSNVYVQSEVVPMEYYSYGTPYPSLANPRLSQINSLPSVPGYISPCVSPCVYPAQAVAAVSPVNPNPNVLTYNAPSTPIVVAPTKQEATGYEYSYVVYDQNTGDHKAQRELSDGSVVRGEYSFLQPDGYIREVQYVADDVSGFKAVVKNFIPIAEEGHNKGTTNENKESPPCHEVKNESLKERSDEKLHKQNSKEESDEKLKVHHGKPKYFKEDSEGKHDEQSKKVSQEDTEKKTEKEFNEERYITYKHSKETNNDDRSEGHTKENSHIKHKYSKEIYDKESEESSPEGLEEIFKKLSPGTSKEYADAFKEQKTSTKVSNESGKKLDEESESDDLKGELLKQSNAAVVPYKDILKCIEIALGSNHGAPAIRQEPSPLTYIVLNKPC